MASGLLGRWRWTRWVFLGAAGLVLVAFLVAQQQSTDVSYGRSPAAAELSEDDDSGDGASASGGPGPVPSVAEMSELLAADPVVRLPGAIASWDEEQVAAAIGDADVRILVAPPGLDDAANDRVREVDNATVRVVGTRVTGGFYEASATTLPQWRAQFATGDVTGPLVHLITALTEQADRPDPEPPGWREPTDAELAEVAADLRDTGLHLAPGATLTGAPAAGGDAFPGADPLFVALPRQPTGEPLPAYGPALTAEFPDTPIVVLYGAWVEYHGPAREEFAELVAASFYGQHRGPLSREDYPQDNVLHAYLGRVTDVRYAGLFDLPLPYQPFDPLRVALPVLPWLFAGCVAVFLGLSVRSLRRPATGPDHRWGGQGTQSALLAGLSALAVEMSLLTDRHGDPPLVRGIGKLQAAREALAGQLPAGHVGELLADAWDELDAAARGTGLAFLRPQHYLRTWST